METVHGPKLGSLVGELLQPLDLGKEQLFLFSRCTSLPCCACLVISFWDCQSHLQSHKMKCLGRTQIVREGVRVTNAPPVPCRGVPGASSHGKFSKLRFLDLGHSGILDRTPKTPPPLGPLQKCYCKRCMSDSSVFFCVVHRSSKLCSSHQFLKGRRARTHCKPGKSCVRSFCFVCLIHLNTASLVSTGQNEHDSKAVSSLRLKNLAQTYRPH